MGRSAWRAGGVLIEDGGNGTVYLKLNPYVGLHTVRSWPTQRHSLNGITQLHEKVQGYKLNP